MISDSSLLFWGHPVGHVPWNLSPLAILVMAIHVFEMLIVICDW